FGSIPGVRWLVSAFVALPREWRPSLMPSRCIVLLLDGLGDRFYTEMDGTPLQAAHTPNLDALAQRGANGLFHADRLGMALTSQDAHFLMFGYEWDEIPRRGVLEALGSGLPLSEKDVAVLARLVSATVEDRKLIVADRLSKADDEELSELIRDVAAFEWSGIRFEFVRTSGAMGILKLTGNVSPLITDVDKVTDNVTVPALRPWRSAETDTAAQNTARAGTEYLRWAHKRLRDHPVNQARSARGEPRINAILTHLAGSLKPSRSFSERWGMKALFISSKRVGWGMAAAMGVDTLKVKDSGDPAADIARRLEIAREKLAAYDFLYVNTMAPDIAAHTKVPAAKKQAIESLDRGIGSSVGPLVNDPDVLLAVTSDHSTPSSGPLIHSGEPVPLLFVGEGVRRDSVKHFDEVACSQGSLGTLRGKEFMYMVLNYLNRSRLHGQMYTTEYRAYREDEYEPFLID
ncbi:MAG: alkaline phosphatase family protein, partial [Deltaproteobacteria bacterium]